MLVKIDDVECISGCGLRIGHTEVVPLDMLLGVEVRVQDQCVVVGPTGEGEVAHNSRERGKWSAGDSRLSGLVKITTFKSRLKHEPIFLHLPCHCRPFPTHIHHTPSPLSADRLPSSEAVY